MMDVYPIDGVLSSYREKLDYWNCVGYVSMILEKICFGPGKSSMKVEIISISIFKFEFFPIEFLLSLVLS